MSEEYPGEKLSDLTSVTMRKLLEASGKDLVQQIGIETTRKVVPDVLSGKNL